MIILCPYCGSLPELVDSSEVYSKSYGNIWLCRPCEAWVGVHKNSNNQPLGRLANKELRTWKRKAHAAFDPYWKIPVSQGGNKKHYRSSAYIWLAEQMGISVDRCHIGMFDIEQCKQVIRICLPMVKNYV